GEEGADGSDPAAEEGVRAGAVGDADAPHAEEADLLGGDVHAVRGQQTRAKQAGSVEPADPARPRRVDEQVAPGGELALAANEPLELRLALVEVRADGESGLVGRGVRLVRH